MPRDFKICTATKILAEFSTLTLSVKDALVSHSPEEEAQVQIDWRLEDGKMNPEVNLSEFNDFRICFNAKDGTIYTDNESIKLGKSGFGSYEIHNCYVTSLIPTGWEGTAKSISFSPSSIEQKKLRKVY